jgi:hypothetical protein
VVAAVVVNANPAQKVRASPVLRATHRLHPAATVHKAHRVLKARAMAAEKVAVMGAVTATAKAVVDKASAAIRALTTGPTAKAVPHRAAHVLKAVALPVAAKVVKVAVKTVAVMMATNCHATLTRSKPRSLHAWTCPTASPCAPVASLTRPAPASTAWPAVAAVTAVVATVAVATAAAMVVAEAEAASVADQPPAP